MCWLFCVTEKHLYGQQVNNYELQIELWSADHKCCIHLLSLEFRSVAQ